MKVIKKRDGGVVQLIDKKKMEDWPVELPLLFVEYIRDKKLDSYGSAKKEVEQYLNEIVEEVALIPPVILLFEISDELAAVRAVDGFTESLLALIVLYETVA